MALTRKRAESLGWRFVHEHKGGDVPAEQKAVGRDYPKSEPSYRAVRDADPTGVGDGLVEQHGASLDQLLERIEAWENWTDRGSKEEE